MSKASESGQAFLDQILAKLPEGVRDTVKTSMTDDALATLGDGVLARADYSKNMDDLTAKKAIVDADHQKLVDWYAANKADLEAVPTLRQEVAKLKGGNPNPEVKVDPKTGLTPEEISKQILEAMNERDKGYADALAMASEIPTDHFIAFNERVDMGKVKDLAVKNGISLRDAHRIVYADKFKEKADKELAAEVDKRVEAKYQERLKSHPEQPFPLRNQGASVLDVLSQTPEQRSAYSADAAAAEYARLENARG